MGSPVGTRDFFLTVLESGESEVEGPSSDEGFLSCHPMVDGGRAKECACT